jgi:hypothetical protein
MNTMDCDEVAALVEWEREGRIGAQELESLRAHVAGCQTCEATWGALMGLIERDAGAAWEVAATDSAFVAAVMGRIGHEAGTARPRGWRLPLAAAAAVFLALGLGLVVGLRAANDRVTVHLVLAAPAATSVAVAGDFNGWKAEGWELVRKRDDGPWEIELRLKRGGVYSYNFVIDGKEWIADPSTDERVDDGFGGVSSLLRI